MSSKKKLIEALYRNFNERNLDEVLRYLTSDVAWANGWEGGFVHGRSAVKDYWNRQFESINPKVQPVIVEEDGNEVVVTVRQLVSTAQGAHVSDSIVKHVFRFDGELIGRFEIGDKDEVIEGAGVEEWIKRLK